MIKQGRKSIFILVLCLDGLITISQSSFIKTINEEYIGNPVIKDMFTADPCPLVYNDTLYLFTGHDEQNIVDQWFYMHNWYVFSTDNMYDYTNHGALLSVDDFSWAKSNAFAGHCIEHNGKFWWYVPMTHNTIKVGEGFAIGVAVADHPLGPYEDAKGEAIITDYTPNSITLNIDPAVFIDDDGQVYLFWGSWGECRMVKLKDNMIEMNGIVNDVPGLTGFFEAPFVHKRNGIYYLTYASGYPSTTAYATSTSITGPWTYQGEINGLIENSNTNHQGIVEYKDNWYFVYHNAGLPSGGQYRRSVCVDELEYYMNGLIKYVERTTTSVPKIESNYMNEGTIQHNKRVTIYPNPSFDGHISIKPGEITDINTPPKITIYDRTGKRVFAIQNFQKAMDIYLNQGLYLLKVSYEKTLTFEKTVVL